MGRTVEMTTMFLMFLECPLTLQSNPSYRIPLGGQSRVCVMGSYVLWEVNLGVNLGSVAARTYALWGVMRWEVCLMRGSAVHINITPYMSGPTFCIQSHNFGRGMSLTKPSYSWQILAEVNRRLISAARCRDHLTVSVTIKQVLNFQPGQFNIQTPAYHPRCQLGSLPPSLLRCSLQFG